MKFIASYWTPFLKIYQDLMTINLFQIFTVEQIGFCISEGEEARVSRKIINVGNVNSIFDNFRYIHFVAYER